MKPLTEGNSESPLNKEGVLMYDFSPECGERWMISLLLATVLGVLLGIYCEFPEHRQAVMKFAGLPLLGIVAFFPRPDPENGD